MNKKKKLNPRRIPLAKSEIDKTAILDEATEGDMYEAWLLVAHSLIEQHHATTEEIGTLADRINDYASKRRYADATKRHELRRIEKVIGMPNPYENLNISAVKSPYDLEKFKKKVKRLALHTSLCVLAFGLEESRKYSEEELRSIFFSVDLTLAEIEAGINSYKNIEKELAAMSLVIDVAETQDMTRVLVKTTGGRDSTG